MPIETKVYKTQDGVPLVSSEFLPTQHVWVLTLMGEQTPDNRLTHSFLRDGLIPALRDVRQQWTEWVENDETDGGAALVTTAQPSSKIFSNGLDLFNAIADPYFFNEYFNPLFTELLTFPIPTIAAIGGHAFAGGCTLALAHDYRVMNGARGYLCMNEIEFGAPIPSGMFGAVKAAVKSPRTMRMLVLEGHRFTANEAREHQLVDLVADSANAVLDQAIGLAEKVRSRSAKNAWQINKELIHAESIAMQHEPPRAKSKI